MTQFKDKAAKMRKRRGLACMLTCLMAADILFTIQRTCRWGGPKATFGAGARFCASIRGMILNILFSEPYMLGRTRDVPAWWNIKDEQVCRIRHDHISLASDADLIAKKFNQTDAGEVPSSTDDFEGRAEAKNLMTLYAAMMIHPWTICSINLVENVPNSNPETDWCGGGRYGPHHRQDEHDAGRPIP